jgi:(p)ppGpp synthase/HD superfamily hydrolase
MNRYEALRHAIKAHGPETDWCGNLYIFHPMEVARRLDDPMRTEASTEDAVVVALLHDVLEDTDYLLRQDDFHPEQWRALNLVTHWHDLTYREYIERIAESGSRVAIMVKLADLSHNMSDERKENLTPEKLAKAERMTKQRYEPARRRLWDALGVEWWPK